MAEDVVLDDDLAPQGASLSDQLVAVLQRRIISGEIPIGTWLRHSALAEEFGISRTPVREALRILASQGIVTIAPNRGAQVNGQSGHDIREIGQVRAELEGLAAALACDRIDDRQTLRMMRSWDEFRASLDEPVAVQAERWAKSNDHFHSVILEAAGNKYLTLTIRELRRRLPHNLSFGAYAGNSRLIRKNLQEHEAITNAILAQDAGLARRLMTEHIRNSNEAIAHWVDQFSGVRPETVRRHSRVRVTEST
ncbi:GntR family transcriptional regulator [Acrocarpospora pleiomorpha]|uniref:GntR family transcriptional regulator n=1 Tax=Acrocarpospora pleiomorpha TaxID=90975 RepID=A0A5M3XGD1_9ACTN|nr:GntR family transcriptional regulator [Acrocarpospora pleiomorpha]GES17168.1 GntR family transcriptional regulator [Acrocarpospora pleiomorpha]